MAIEPGRLPDWLICLAVSFKTLHKGIIPLETPFVPLI